MGNPNYFFMIIAGTFFLQPIAEGNYGVGFGAVWRGGTLVKKRSFVSTSALCSEQHSCSEGHFLRILFGRTFIEDCIRKDTCQSERCFIQKWSEHLFYIDKYIDTLYIYYTWL